METVMPVDAFSRQWELRIYVGRPPTINAERAAHWTKRSASTKVWRQAGWTYAAHLRMPRNLNAITVAVAPLLRSHARQDVGACLPAAKAVIDGLVDYGLIADDDAKHLQALTFLPARRSDTDGLYVEISEA